MTCICTFKTGAIKYGILTGLASDRLVAALPLTDVLECLERNDWRPRVAYIKLKELAVDRACAVDGKPV